MQMQVNEPPLPRPSIGSPVKLVIGAFFAALGVILTLDNLGYWGAHVALRYWPAVLVAAGAAKATDSVGRTFGIMMMGVGAVLLAHNARWIHFSMFRLWPLALVLAGGLIVAHSLGGWSTSDPQVADRNIWAILSNRTVTVPREFIHQRVFAFLGGCDLDLSGAEPSGPPVVVDATAMWGGIVVRVPEGWEVVGEAVPFMGGIDIRTKAAAGGRQLIIRGFAFMAGIEIKTVGDVR